jgi:hypothetical protein
MAKLKFVGEWERLEELGYLKNNQEEASFCGYWKAAPGFALWVWEKRELSLIDYSKGVTALIYQYLVDNNFEVKEKYGRLVCVKETDSITVFDYDKHHIMGIYGMEYTQEDCLKYRGQFIHILMNEELVSLFKELKENKLIEFSTE